MVGLFLQCFPSLPSSSSLGFWFFQFRFLLFRFVLFQLLFF
jgi:hypothetical protein